MTPASCLAEKTSYDFFVGISFGLGLGFSIKSFDFALGFCIGGKNKGKSANGKKSNY